MTYDIEKPWNKLLKLKSLPFGSISCIDDVELENEVIDIINKVSRNRCLTNIGIQEKFLNRYYQWIQETKFNKFINIEKFHIKAFSNGTTEAFDKFYLKFKNKRIRYFRGEYMYHLAAADNYFDRSAYIDDEPLCKGDVVILSLPFADTGNPHQNLKEVLETCEILEIPVMIDCCYFGVCKDIEFNFNYDCIYGIVFSLSKVFPVQHLRIGMRLTKEYEDDPLSLYNRNRYTNKLGAAVGLELLERYSPDYNQNRYASIQKEFCDELEVTPSNCVFFANTADEKFIEYNRGTANNRLCLSKYLKSGKLP
jgi:hypothetical protein